jgi:hypothetical protein
VAAITVAGIMGRVGVASPPASRRVQSSARLLPARRTTIRQLRHLHIIAHIQITRIAGFDRPSRGCFGDQIIAASIAVVASRKPAEGSRMAVIDTLKLARALHDKGGFSQDAADATAEAINAALGEDVATKSDIKLLDGKITLLLWAVGINVAATVTMLVKHW